MPIDTAAKRSAALAGGSEDTGWPAPSGAVDTVAERAHALGVYSVLVGVIVQSIRWRAVRFQLTVDGRARLQVE